MGDDGADPTVDEVDLQSNGCSTGDGAAIDTDQVLDALAHPRRRHLLRELADEGPEVSLRQLAAGVAAAESEDSDGATDELRQRVYVSLFHRHVPKLDDQGFVEYDDEADVVRAVNLDPLQPINEILGD